MSRRRNRHRSLSSSSQRSERPLANNSTKYNFGRSTTHSLWMNPEQLQEVNYDLHKADQVFHKNISFFRDNFKQTDRSQLPFMSSLREPHTFRSQGPKTITIVAPFEAALKNTSNQLIKKNVSDFDAKQRRLSVAAYRWHKSTGKNNKWSTNFECSLRDYGGKWVDPQKQFYPFIKPIAYKDVEPLEYSKQEMICPRHNRSFKLR